MKRAQYRGSISLVPMTVNQTKCYRVASLLCNTQYITANYTQGDMYTGTFDDVWNATIL